MLAARHFQKAAGVSGAMGEGLEDFFQIQEWDENIYIKTFVGDAFKLLKKKRSQKTKQNQNAVKKIISRRVETHLRIYLHSASAILLRCCDHCRWYCRCHYFRWWPQLVHVVEVFEGSTDDWKACCCSDLLHDRMRQKVHEKFLSDNQP